MGDELGPGNRRTWEREAVSLNYVNLTLDLFDGAGNLLNGGSATFTPTAQLTDATDQEIITQAPVAVTFRGSSPVVRLLATDNASVMPAGWAWEACRRPLHSRT